MGRLQTGNFMTNPYGSDDTDLPLDTMESRLAKDGAFEWRRELRWQYLIACANKKSLLKIVPLILPLSTDISRPEGEDVDLIFGGKLDMPKSNGKKDSNILSA